MKKLTQEEFLKKCVKKHGLRYNYDKAIYSGKLKSIVINCNIHGDFEQCAESHYNGSNCPKCMSLETSKRLNKGLVNFIIEANLKHNNFFDYSKFIYKNAHSKGIITCVLHGEFTQDPHSHLKGSKCPKCSKEQADKWGWSKSKWIEKASKKYPKLYIIKCFNENEEFIKIGITSKLKLSQRLSQIPYKYEVLSLYENEAEIIWNLEKLIQQNFKKTFKYIPLIQFKGMYECLTLNCYKDLQYWIKKHKQNYFKLKL